MDYRCHQDPDSLHMINLQIIGKKQKKNVKLIDNLAFVLKRDAFC